MKITCRGKNSLRRALILERKSFFINKIMSGELNPIETEEAIAKVARCNEILFEIKMNASTE